MTETKDIGYVAEQLFKLETGRYGNLYVRGGIGYSFNIDRVTVRVLDPNENMPEKGVVVLSSRIYPINSETRPWKYEHYWLHEGPWQKDIEDLALRADEINEGLRLKEMERVNGILNNYKQS